MSFLMKSFKLFSSLIKLDLGCLSFCNFLFELICFTRDFNCELLNLKCELFYFGFISPSIFFQSQVIFLFLSCSKCPLFKLFLVPIHFKFKLIHALISFENHVLNVVETILLVGYSLLQLFDFIFKSTRLTLSDLFEVFFSLNFFVFRVN